MLESRPSATAMAVAELRALHQRSDHPVVFEDALADRIIGEAGRARLDSWAAEAPHTVRLRASVAARSRIAEDRLRDAAAGGVRQYVLLGAGLDTFGFRSPAGVQVFEVDHPATQAWKLERLEEAALRPPSTLTFIPHDFERQPLRTSLSQAGFRFDQPAVFALLGVFVYIECAAILQTLGLIGGMPPGLGTVVFDYGEPPARATPPVRDAYEALAGRAAAQGEPFRTYFDPADLAAELRAMSFTRIEDEGAANLAARLFADRTDGLAPGPLSHIVTAWN